MKIGWPAKSFYKHESLWIKIFKLSAFNFLSRRSLVRCFRSKSVLNGAISDLRSERYWNITRIAEAARVDVSEFANASTDEIWDGQEDGVRCWTWNHLCFCSECLSLGFHSILFQIRDVTKCPQHGSPIRDRCPHCSTQIPLIIPAVPTPAVVCVSCRKSIGKLVNPKSPSIDEKCHGDAIESAKRMIEKNDEDVEWVFHRVGRRPNRTMMGVALEKNRSHFKLLFDRYSSLASPGLCQAMGVVAPLPKIFRTNQNHRKTEEPITTHLARLYRRMTKRWRRKLSCRGRGLSRRVWSRGVNEIAEDDWTYLLSLSFWESCSPWSITGGSPSQGGRKNFHQALGEILVENVWFYHLADIDDSQFHQSDSLWAALHVFAISFRTARSEVESLLKSHIPLERVLIDMRLLGNVRPPAVILTQRVGGVELTVWDEGQRCSAEPSN